MRGAGERAHSCSHTDEERLAWAKSGGYSGRVLRKLLRGCSEVTGRILGRILGRLLGRLHSGRC